MGIREGGCVVDVNDMLDNVVKVLYMRRWEYAIGGALLFFCVTCAILLLCFMCSKIRDTVRRRRRKREDVGETTLDLSMHVEGLRAYAGEVYTLVDIGYYSETEVIE